MKMLASCLLLLASFALAHANESVIVTSKFFLKGEWVSSPEVITQYEDDVSVGLENTYEMHLRISPRDHNRVSISAKIDIGGKHYSPTIISVIGEEATIEIGPFKWDVLVNHNLN